MSHGTRHHARNGNLWRAGVALVASAAFLVPIVSSSPASAVTPGSDGRIAYTATDGSLQTIEPNGTRKLQIAPDGGYPAWSPDGTKVAFLRNNRDIWIVDADGTNLIRVTSDAVDKAGLAWRPDGLKLAFTTLTKIRLVTPAASQTAFTDVGPAVNGDTEFYQFLDWSPDGAALAYGHFVRGTPNVYAIKTRLLATPFTVTTVVTSDTVKTEPRWSPDGSTVLWSQESVTNSRTSDGSGSITSLVASSMPGATWSPSGKLAFRAPGASGSISTANANGSSPVTVPNTTDSRETNNAIGWGPRAKCNGLSATHEGTSGNDTITGTSGDDVILGWGGDDNLDGAGGNDTICGMRGDDPSLSGGDGNDRLYGGDGTDNIRGAAGDDDLFGEASYDFLIGGAGNDDLDGGASSAMAVFNDRPTAVTATLPTGSATTTAVLGAESDTLKSLDHIQGTNQDDTLTGNSNYNLIQGDGGVDTINAMDGDDIVIAGPGADIVDGGNGSDLINYADPRTTGVTVVLGNPGSGGNDAEEGPGLRDSLASIERVVGTEHDDTLTGTDGNVEAEYLHGENGKDTLTGGGGPDNLRGGNGDDSLNGGAGIDEISGNDGSDVLDGGPDADYLDGGDGNYDEETDSELPHADTVSYAQHPAGVSVSLDDAENDGSPGEGDNVQSVEDINGSPFEDVLIGDEAANTLNGGGGTDTADYSAHSAGVKITLDGVANDGNAAEGIKDNVRTENVVGTTGTDTLIGSSAANRISGGDGNDALDGGFGADVFAGGAGTDTVSYSARTTAVRANLSNGLADDGGTEDGAVGARDTIGTEVERIFGGAGADVLSGNSLANALTGLSGNDILLGGGGNDALSGGPGNDSLNGSTGADTMDGGTGLDTASYSDRTTSTGGVVVSIDNKANDGSSVDGSSVRDNVLTSVENLLGGAGNDTLSGSAATNRLTGMKGADRLFGQGGNDVLLAKDGIKDLILNGGSGTDSGAFDSGDPARISVP